MQHSSDGPVSWQARPVGLNEPNGRMSSILHQHQHSHNDNL